MTSGRRWLEPVTAEHQSRLNPRVYDRSYLLLDTLRRHLTEEISRLPNRTRLRVLDVGCGSKPYYALVASRASAYVGTDVKRSQSVDVLSVAERLPFRSDTFDLVLCTQVLEHVLQPPAVVEEIRRVLTPGGVLLLSTHGIWFKHEKWDFWRWTDMGLRVLLSGYQEVEIRNCGGSMVCLFQILNNYFRHIPLGRSLIYTMNNILGETLDRVVESDEMVINYLAVARKGDAP